ncbi:MAG: large conductance mechanosensitive channel protein MscL [Alphaproteobacteria bacterium]
MLKEFKEFISRGSVIDLAVGIVIGAAFTSVVNSLVNDIIMPPIGLALAGINFSDLFITLSPGSYASLEEAKAAGAATWNYGQFINAIISFLIVSFAIFVLVKAINRLRRKQEAAPATPPAPPRSELLLEEIRDLLKK